MKKRGRTGCWFVFLILLFIVCYVFINTFWQPLSEGTRVKINGKGYFNPLCCGDYPFENWSGSQRRQWCWNRATLVEETIGVIEAGGDYETHYSSRGGSAYRVVFTTTLGNQRTLWFSVDSLEKID
ncbi:MAG: hypothetical protein ACOYJ8_01490 [Patescibacteria group bacterium]|jgi:hypothetical protein